ncbi:MAG: hypothetical protein DRI44_04935 [Chlamydiae bacterium]|nr:MAG: hypothetical protein DRI44_04935 [Chlamydiota bacterium]
MDLNSTTTIVILYIVGTIVLTMLIFIGGKIFKIKSGFWGALVISAVLCAVSLVGIEYSKETKKKEIASYPEKANELYLEAEQLMNWKDTDTKTVQKKYNKAKGNIDCILSKYASTDLAEELKKHQKKIAGYSLWDFYSFQETIAILIEYEKKTNCYENLLPWAQAGNLSGIADLYITVKNNKKANELLDQVVTISESIDFSEDKIYSLLKIASLCIKIGQNEKADKLLNIVLEQNQKKNNFYQKELTKSRVASMYIKMQEKSKVLNLIKTIRIPRIKVAVLGELAVDYAKSSNNIPEKIVLDQIFNVASLISDSSVRELELDKIRCNYARNGMKNHFNISNIIEKTAIAAKQNEQKSIVEEKIRNADKMQQNHQKNATNVEEEKNAGFIEFKKKLGVIVKNLDSSTRNKYTSEKYGGVLITELKEESLFKQAGAELNGVVFHVADSYIKSEKDFDDALKKCYMKNDNSFCIMMSKNNRCNVFRIAYQKKGTLKKHINSNLKINGDYFYGTTGKATIKQLGKKITMELTALPNSAPAPHYIFKGFLDRNKITGAWNFTIRRSRWKEFEAVVKPDGEIRISKIDDNEGHGLRNLAIMPLSILKKTSVLKKYNTSIGSFIKCEEILKVNLTVSKGVYGETEKRFGLYIASIETDSPLAKAGAQAGDIIINVAGKQVWSMESFAYALNTAYQKNKTVYLVVKRGNKMKYLTVRL